MSRHTPASERVTTLRAIVKDLRFGKTSRQEAIRELRPLERELGLEMESYNGK